jgi:hypothetical protein
MRKKDQFKGEIDNHEDKIRYHPSGIFPDEGEDKFLEMIGIHFFSRI